MGIWILRRPQQQLIQIQQFVAQFQHQIQLNEMSVPFNRERTSTTGKPRRRRVGVCGGSHLLTGPLSLHCLSQSDGIQS